MGVNRIPMLPYLAAFLAGRLGAEFCPPAAWPMIGLMALFGIGAVSLGMRFYSAARATLVALFAVLGYVAAPSVPVPDDVRFVLLDQETPGVFEGKVIRSQARPGGRAKVSMAVQAACFPQGCQSVGGQVAMTFEGEPPPQGAVLRFRTRFARLEPSGNPGQPDRVHTLLRQGFVRKGFVAAGDWVVIHRVAPHGAREPPEGLVAWLRQLRARTRHRIEVAFASRFPDRVLGLALGLALGDRSRIDEVVRTWFANAGLAHLLAISGTHMALVALGLEMVVRHLLLLFPVTRRRGRILGVSPLVASLGIVVYASLVGLTPAMGRALLMGVCALLLRATSRRVETMAVLVLAALVVVVVEPNAMWDVGCQLSFVSVVFLVRLVPVASRKVRSMTIRVRAGRTRRLVTGLIEVLAVSAVATVGTAPLCAYYFQAIPWVGVVANAVAVPLVAGLGLPLVILSALSSLVGLPGTDVLFLVTTAVLRGGIAVAGFFGGAPALAPFAIALSTTQALLFALLTGLLLLEVRGRRWVVLGAGLAMGLLLWWTSRPAGRPGEFRVTQLNVGQGDCFVLEFSDGRVAVLDGGGSANPQVYLRARGGTDGGGASRKGADPGRRVILPYLRSRGYHRIDILMLSHPHPDHVGGLFSLVAAMPVGEAWIAEPPDREGLMSRYVDELLSRGVPVFIVDADTPPRRVAGVRFRILHPFRGWRARMPTKRGRSTNNGSMVLVASYGRMDMLFTGDMEKEVETMLAAAGKLPRVEWVKVPHHGSDTSSTSVLVDSTRPEVAAISVGRDNRYGFPRRSVVRRWNRAGATVFRTDRHGAVVYTTDGDHLHVRPVLEERAGDHAFDAFEDTRVPAGEAASWALLPYP